MMALRRLNRRQTNFVLTEVMGIVLALAVAFFFVAMPADVFEGMVAASGLPTILPAAAPPLSDTTRMILAALAGSLAGILVILMFLFIDRDRETEPETVNPFFVNSDVGPIDMMSFTSAKPLGARAAREETITVPFEIVDVSDVSRVEAVKDEPIFLDFQAIRAARAPVDEAPLDLSQWKMSEPEPQSAPAAVPAPKPAPVATPAPVASHAPELEQKPLPISAPSRRVDEDSISALMKRLESGLERRADRGSAPAQPPEINRSGAGVRSTLEELRKMAVRR